MTNNSIDNLLEGNKSWVRNVTKMSPAFFQDLAKGQTPEYLWIGCSDSRVPATEITNTLPGSIFVQRNIANMVIHTDSNVLSVINYAVKVLKVKHIIVCGHYGCGGVLAAMSNNKFGFLDNWLMHIKDVYRLHEGELDGIDDLEERGRRFVELNVVEQVLNLSRISFIQEEWEIGEFPYIHGLVYSLEDGVLHDLEISVNSKDGLHTVFQYKNVK
ncbi:MAG: carbonic anhydrase [Bacteroidia bacterium]|nr:carbonic anhydrase [Bacteroidia bacterium]